MKTIRELFIYGKNALSARDISSPEFEAKQLLSHLTGISPGEIPRSEKTPLPGTEEALGALLSRRIAREPLQYILGEWEFYSLPFKLSPGVLIPRPETELLVDLALRALTGIPAPEALDLCTGSGCIAAAIAKNRPDARVTASDCYDTPLKIAAENIKALSLTNAETRKLDILAPAPPETEARFHLITANPPYLTETELDTLQTEVKAEPREALYGGRDGLRFYRAIAGSWTNALRPGGTMILEIGHTQAEDALKIFENVLTNIKIHRDLSNNDRILTGQKERI